MCTADNLYTARLDFWVIKLHSKNPTQMCHYVFGFVFFPCFTSLVQVMCKQVTEIF